MLLRKTTQYSKVWDHQTDLSDSLSFYCYFLPSISTIYSRLCLLITTHQWYYHKEYARLWSCRMDWTMIPNPTVSYFLEDPIHRDWHPWCSRSWGVQWRPWWFCSAAGGRSTHWLPFPHPPA